jgi:hypothetical protein
MLDFINSLLEEGANLRRRRFQETKRLNGFQIFLNVWKG